MGQVLAALFSATEELNLPIDLLSIGNRILANFLLIPLTRYLEYYEGHLNV